MDTRIGQDRQGQDVLFTVMPRIAKSISRFNYSFDFMDVPFARFSTEEFNLGLVGGGEDTDFDGNDDDADGRWRGRWQRRW